MRRLVRTYFGTTDVHQPRLKPRANDSRRSVIGRGDWPGDPSAEILAVIVNEQPDLIVIGGDLLDSREASPHAVKMSATKSLPVASPNRRASLVSGQRVPFATRIITSARTTLTNPSPRTSNKPP